MTVLEAIKSNPITINVPRDYVETVLISRGVTASEVFSESSLKDVELVTADLFVALALLPEFKEGQLALKYDASELRRMALRLYEKHDDPKALEVGPNKIDVRVRNVN